MSATEVVCVRRSHKLCDVLIRASLGGSPEKMWFPHAKYGNDIKLLACQIPNHSNHKLTRTPSSYIACPALATHRRHLKLAPSIVAAQQARSTPRAQLVLVTAPLRTRPHR